MDGAYFQFVRASHHLSRALADQVEHGESVALLSYRNGGKVLVARHVQKLLAQRGLGPVVFVKLQAASPIDNDTDFQAKIAAAIREAGYNPPARAARDLLDLLDWLRGETGKPPILIAANVDSMAQPIARRFLKGVRSMVDTCQLITVLTGEYDLCELVHGPNSEFNVAHQYVLQGLDWDLFSEELQRYCAALQIEFAEEEARCELWKMTGGNAYILRVILWAIVESKAKQGCLEPVTASAVREWMRQTPILGINEAHLLRIANRLIPTEPSVWPNLRRLTMDGETQVRDPKGPPAALTLSGIARREGDRLVFASPIMADIVRRHYDDLAIGDLYAGIGFWDESFAYYRRVERVRLIRPTNSEDIPRFAAVIDSLTASLHTHATKGSTAVRKLFEDGCQQLMGFPEVTFWARQRGEKWRPAWNSPASRRAIESVEEILEDAHVPPSQVLKAPPYWEGAVFAASLSPPEGEGEAEIAVIVGDFDSNQRASRSRRRLLEEVLLPHFIRAHDHASDIEKVQQRLHIRNQNAVIINSIASRLGTQVLDVREVLRDMAAALKSGRYKRIAFALIDEKNEFIEGVVDCSDDPAVDLAQITRWPISDPQSNVNSYVVQTCKPKIIENAATDPLSNKDAVRRARLTAYAIVPLLLPKGHPIGTMFVERADGQPPNLEEVDDFLELGRQVAALIEHAGRVNLLQKALDRVTDPILIFDPQVRVRYGNQAAAELLNLTAGWYDPADAPICQNLGNLSEDVQAALKSGPSLRHFRGLTHKPLYAGSASCAPIPDWRKRVCGAVLQLHDWTYPWKIVEAFRMAFEAPDRNAVFHALLKGMKLLGHKWGRLYLLEGEGPDRILRSAGSFGIDNPALREKFDTSQFCLPPQREAGEESWACLDENHPVLFCCTTEAGNTTNKNGVSYKAIPNPSCPPELAKHPNDWWVDFPLIAGGRHLGKVTLQAEESINNEHFEFLSVLCYVASELMRAFERREVMDRQRQTAMKTEAGQKSLALVSHHIATRFAGLDGLIERYKGRAKRQSAVTDLTDELSRAYGEIYSMLERVKLHTKVVEPKPSKFDLAADVRGLLAERFPEGGQTVKGPDKLEIEADRGELQSAFREIIQNAVEIVPRETLRLNASIECGPPVPKGTVRILFEDNGPGVRTELKEKIFDYFFTERLGRAPGTGLGLAYVRSVIEAHNGQIRENGEPGRGARFEIDLPLAQKTPVGERPSS